MAAVFLIGLLLGSVALAGSASAHASLLSTDPTEGQVLASAPSQVSFTFDEPVRSINGGVHLFDAKGEELKASSRTSDAQLLVDLPGSMEDGTYVVAWRVISADGHPVAGALTFSVGAPSATVAATTGVPQASPVAVRASLGIAQALTYLGIFGACGLVVFVLLTLRGQSGLDLIADLLLVQARRFAWLVVAAGFATVVLTVLYQEAKGFGDLFGDGPLHIPADAGLLSWVLAGVGTWVAVLAARRTPVATFRVVALGGVVLALVSLGLVGHTRAFPPLWLMLATDLIHVAAGSVWFGGLIGLVLSLRRLADRPRVAAVVLGRFSAVAGWLLLGVAVTGSVLGWRILDSWSALVDTDFGRVLLVKVGFVAVVAAIAGWNRYRLMPAVLADSGFADRGAASARMRRTVRAEALLLVVVLGLTGFLVDRSPVPAAGPIALPGALDSSTFTGLNGTVKVVAVVQPAKVGQNDVLFQLQDTAGDPIEPAAVPTIGASLGSLSLGDQAVTDVDSGTYRASVLIPKPGTWSLQVSVRLSEFDNPVVTITVPVQPAR